MRKFLSLFFGVLALAGAVSACDDPAGGGGQQQPPPTSQSQPSQ